MEKTWGLKALQSLFGDTEDLVVRTLRVNGTELTLLFLDGLTSGGEIAEDVIRPLVRGGAPASEAEIYDAALHGAVYCASVQTGDTPQQTAQGLLTGHAALLFPALGKALCFEVKTSQVRGPEAPDVENTVKGARDAFTETLRINTGLIRRHLRTAELLFVQRSVGKRSGTSVAVCYLEGLSNPEMVHRLLKRLEKIEIDGLLSPASVEEYVTGSRRTAFPLLQYTQRADRFCQELLGGQIGLLVDGLPLGYLLPVTLAELMRAQEDRAMDYVSASCVRLLRYAALMLALLLPGFYAALAGFHPEMIPTKLLLAIIESKQEVPFPTILELLGLLAAFELLQEAGLHLPQAIGTTVSIIGGLVVGTAAVDARLVSPAALIVAASSGICGFTLPSRDLSNAVRVWRFALTAMAGIAGLLGLCAGAVLLLIHLSGLESLGCAYLAPFSQAEAASALLRPRLKERKFRNPILRPQDMKNQR